MHWPSRMTREKDPVWEVSERTAESPKAAACHQRRYIREETAFSWITITFLLLCLACWNIPLLFFSCCPIYLVTPHANLGTAKYTVPFEIWLMECECVRRRLRLSENLIPLNLSSQWGLFSLVRMNAQHGQLCADVAAILKKYLNELYQSGCCQKNKNLSRCCKQRKWTQRTG